MFNCICTIFTPEYYPIYSQFCTFLSNHFCTLLEYHLYSISREVAPCVAKLLHASRSCSMRREVAPCVAKLLHASRSCSIINVKIRMYIFDCLRMYNFVYFLLGNCLTRNSLNELTILYFPFVYDLLSDTNRLQY